MINLNNLFDKDVISIIDASRLGEIYDIEINEVTGQINSLILRGRLRFFGLLGRKGNIVVPWGCVRVIGDETILVDLQVCIEKKSKTLLG